MSELTGDPWLAGDACEAYMGRWSRPLARAFVEWLRPQTSSHWLDIGCGTGALASAILERCDPASVVGCDPSAPFVEHARKQIPDARASFVVAGADALPHRASGFDVVVSGLVLNFMPDPVATVASIRERVRLGGTVAAYVWDYALGMEFLRHFWDEAIASDPRAAALDEAVRFPLCREGAMIAAFRASGLSRVEATAVEIPTEFASFDDYWAPFLGGTGPAPSYATSLDAAGRDALRERLRRRLPAESDGRIRMRARAWAVRGLST